MVYSYSYILQLIGVILVLSNPMDSHSDPWCRYRSLYEYICLQLWVQFWALNRIHILLQSGHHSCLLHRLLLVVQLLVRLEVQWFMMVILSMQFFLFPILLQSQVQRNCKSFLHFPHRRLYCLACSIQSYYFDYVLAYFDFQCLGFLVFCCILQILFI